MPVVIIGGEATEYSELGLVRCYAEELATQGIAAIAVRVAGRQSPNANTPNVWHLLKALGAEGTGLRETYIHATGTDPPPTDQDYYLAKINARLNGRNRIIVQDIGQSSEGAARSHARRLLQTVVDNGVQREYQIVSRMPAALPALGDTVTVDDYTGVVSALTWQATGESESMTLTLIDYNSAVLQ
jgi:hypothetical protein